MSRKWALLSRGNQRVECWVFSIWFVKSSKLSAWNEFMSFPGAPSAGPPSHNDREEGGREALVSVDHMSRRHVQHFQDLFPTGSRGFIRPSSSQQPGCVVDTTVLICFPGPPQDAPTLLWPWLCPHLSPYKTLETRHQNTDRLERGTQSKINSS